MYLGIKHLHLMLVMLTVFLFNLRFWLRAAKPQQPLPKALKVLPHINDTLLLASGIGLAFIAGWKPFVNAGWLGVKLVCLLLYIAAGLLAIKSPPRGGKAFAGYAAAMLLLAAMAYLARFKPF